MICSLVIAAFIIAVVGDDIPQQIQDDFFVLRNRLVQEYYCMSSNVFDKELASWDNCSLLDDGVISKVRRECRKTVLSADLSERRQQQCNDSYEDINSQYGDCVIQKCNVQTPKCNERDMYRSSSRYVKNTPAKKKKLKCRERALGLSPNDIIRSLLQFYNSLRKYQKALKTYCMDNPDGDLEESVYIETEMCTFSFKDLRIEPSIIEVCRQRFWADFAPRLSDEEKRKQICSGEDFGYKMERFFVCVNDELEMAESSKKVPVHYQCYIESQGHYNPRDYEIIEAVTRHRSEFGECIEKALGVNRRMSREETETTRKQSTTPQPTVVTLSNHALRLCCDFNLRNVCILIGFIAFIC